MNANDCDRLPAPFCDLECVELDPNSLERPFDVLQWYSYTDGKQYACVSVDSEAVFLTAEESRGKCKLMKHRDAPNQSCLKNVTYICSYSKERHRCRKARQQLGHAAAAQQVRDTQKNGAAVAAPGSAQRTEVNGAAPTIKRVGKNSTGESVTCAACQYSLQLKIFKKKQSMLYLVLRNEQHTNEQGKVAHGKVAGQDGVQKKASAEMRKFILQQHQAGVPADRILQGGNQQPCLIICSAENNSG
jgi:hypothetical protein